MSVYLKKILAFTLAVLLVLGCFAGCSNNGGATTEESTEPELTEPAEEAKVLKVLTLGHSLAVDSTHMLNLVAAAEGYKEMKIGTLYYSGCPLPKHVEYLTNNSPEYQLYISSTETPNDIFTIIDKVTMGDAIKYDYWDIIVMQGGVFEIGRSETYTNGDIQTIQKYVNENKKNPLAKFVWNMTWTPPQDEELRMTYNNSKDNSYFTSYEEYNSNRTTFYNAIAKCVGDHILTDSTFVDMIPSATAMENALSSYLEEKDLHRDYAHASDFGRLMVAYTWFCKLTGVEKLTEIKLDTVPRNFFRSIDGKLMPTGWTLTQAEKDLIIESVNNALANPLQMTQSQYTEAPAK